jgi:hypothetical protein
LVRGGGPCVLRHRPRALGADPVGRCARPCGRACAQRHFHCRYPPPRAGPCARLDCAVARERAPRSGRSSQAQGDSGAAGRSSRTLEQGAGRPRPGERVRPRPRRGDPGSRQAFRQPRCGERPEARGHARHPGGRDRRNDHARIQACVRALGGAGCARVGVGDLLKAPVLQ